MDAPTVDRAAVAIHSAAGSFDEQPTVPPGIGLCIRGLRGDYAALESYLPVILQSERISGFPIDDSKFPFVLYFAEEFTAGTGDLALVARLAAEIRRHIGARYFEQHDDKRPIEKGDPSN